MLWRLVKISDARLTPAVGEFRLVEGFRQYDMVADHDHGNAADLDHADVAVLSGDAVDGQVGILDEEVQRPQHGNTARDWW